MRFFVTTFLLSVCFAPVFAQNFAPAVTAKMSGLAGTYTCVSPSTADGDSMVTELKLTCNPSCKSGDYTVTRTDYLDVRKHTIDKIEGEWYVLENKDLASNADILIIVLDELGPLDTYPLFKVQDDGSLFSLHLNNPERFPLYVTKQDGELFITRKGANPLPVDKALRTRSASIYRTYIKQ